MWGQKCENTMEEQKTREKNKSWICSAKKVLIEKKKQIVDIIIIIGKMFAGVSDRIKKEQEYNG